MDIEREDGEIIDGDDELEEVSDCSIISPYSGKCTTYQDIISSVSLSSISESEFEPKRRYDERERYRPNKRKRKLRTYEDSYSRKKSRKYSETLTESEDDCVDQSILRQLKKAVKINSSNSSKTNSLELRLKRMLNGPLVHEEINGNDVTQNFNNDIVKLDSNKEKDENVEFLHSIALSTKCEVKKEIISKQNDKSQINKSDTIDDEDLTELRLAALKSAVIKKHMKRKRQKEMEVQQHANKFQNSASEIDKENTQHVINNQENYKIENNNEKIDTAIKTIDDKNSEIMTSVSQNALNKSIEEDVDIMRAMLLASMSQKITSIKPAQATNIPTAKMQSNNKLINVYKKTVVNQVQPIQTSKQHLVNVPVKPLVININGDSDSDTDSEMLNKTKKTDNIALKVTQLLKKTRAEVEAKTQKEKIVPSKPEKPISTNSSESQLMEKSVVKLLPKSQQIEYCLLKQKLQNAKNKVNQNLRKVPKNKRKDPEIKRPNITEASTTNNVNRQTHKNKQPLKEVVKELEDIFLVGRLQIKGKYKELAPLLQKIKLARIQVKKMDSSLKKLMEEIDKVKGKQNVSKQRYTYLVKEICLRKQIIDRRLQMTNLPSDNIMNFTSSTPIKQTNTVETEMLPEAAAADKNEPGLQLQENVWDTENSIFPKYISPLGATSSDNSSDPLGTCCPYDIFGVCRDAECTYKHFS